ncbi:SIS domain-containing protein [Pelomonas sp. SE-A7]|uniref:SIS domain-containing protein n=1 Tax=Pelomonas sp. SE-A7 TaxID=3054953 RepID=UPI00259CEEBB|nr:SIS domain-containing protein [Pelomonas sp. SE-A7]MDM4767666.1 SIS domain-containing protein [Pelomonas sp. SE-A7]
MNTILQRPSQDWRQLGGLDTAEEITQQPRLWRQLAQQLDQSQQARVAAFLGDWLNQPTHRVILTGAGSSAFVGEIVVDELNSAWPAQVRAIATTSLLTHPELYLEESAPTLLVSFARSGNSPESLAAVELLRRRLKAPRFINITCNGEGQLAAQAEGRADSLNLLMPQGSCDRGFAMTSSLSCMLLAALAVLGKHGDAADRIQQLATAAEQALAQWTAPIAALAAQPFDRIVYLGSGPLESLAKEAALKVLELSSGRALALANTALGFRHGPKSALNPASLVIFLRSSKPLAQRYEQDLLDELRRDQVAGHCLSVGPVESGAELAVAAPAGLGDSWLAPLWLIAAQLFSLHKSAALGLTPDNPFPDGTVNRVVQGVTIHPHD